MSFLYLKESEVPLRQEKKKETPSRQNEPIKNQWTNNEKIEKDLISLEEKVAALDKRLLEVEDLDLFQQLSREKEDIEQKWEALFNQLEN